MSPTTPADPWLPVLHGRPAAGWLNDPNGLGRVHGRWHVFFQFNPHAAVHDRIHWGHMTSDDLIHWRPAPVALTPRAGGFDAGGCWSGCLTIDEGVPTLVYTAVDADGVAHAVLATALDPDLESFLPAEQASVALPEDVTITDVRDPYVVTVDGRRFVIQGAGRTAGGVGSVLLYDAADLTRWTLLGPLLRSDDPALTPECAADIWECPNLIRLGDSWVLIVSVWRSASDPNTSHVVWITGDLVPEGRGYRFAPRRSGRLDTGPAFYAPQVVRDGDRHLLWGWAWELPHPGPARDWAGVLTFPRELVLDVGDVVLRPVTELDGLRAGLLPTDTGRTLPAAFEVDAWGPVGLTCAGEPVLETGFVGRIFVDGSLVEAFPLAGQSFTTRAYPPSSDSWTVIGDRTDYRVHQLGDAGGAVD